MIRKSEKISGFKIPGSDDRLVINLFTDDTVVYTHKNDKYDDLQEILDKWCKVSGVKFNKEKTEIIPIGSKAHRSHILQTKKIHPTDNPLSEDVHIAEDGEAIQSLGSWVGNEASNKTPWEPIISKISQIGRASCRERV